MRVTWMWPPSAMTTPSCHSCHLCSMSPSWNIQAAIIRPRSIQAIQAATRLLYPNTSFTIRWSIPTIPALLLMKSWDVDDLYSTFLVNIFLLWIKFFWSSIVKQFVVLGSSFQTRLKRQRKRFSCYPLLLIPIVQKNGIRMQNRPQTINPFSSTNFSKSRPIKSNS